MIKPLQPKCVAMDANEAAASVAYRLNEVFAIYPITPSSPMGEFCDEWAAKQKTNLWGQVPEVMEMQSEAGAAGAVHGSLQAGSLSSSFTCSQGLLLYIPNMYKIAGELLPFVLHVSARALATHALSIFGDHSDVMACRQTGFAMLCGNTPQEAHDLAAIAHTVTLEGRVPFLHYFDGFRSSHEIQKVNLLSDDDLRSLLSEDAVAAFRDRALTPDKPMIRGTAQNPDVFFQARESANNYYAALPGLVQKKMDQFAELTGRQYNLFDYYGDPQAERVIVIMGSGFEAVCETIDYLNKKGAKVGAISVRLFRPFPIDAFIKAIPASVKQIAVLDRVKESGAIGEPLYLDVIAALAESGRKIEKVIGGRYGLGSKEFTPAMIIGVYDNLAKEKSKNHFTVGIVDDVSGTSLDYDMDLDIETDDVTRAVFFGLGADGTVSANKNSIKIIGEGTDFYAQGYFVYDSKKSGAMTTSHLRFGPKPIRSTYLVRQANFVACHQQQFLDKVDMTTIARPGATFLINATGTPQQVWDSLPLEMQQALIAKKMKVYTMDAYKVAKDSGMTGQINTVMQTAFFALAGILPKEEAIAAIKKAIQKSYGKKGEDVVKKNWTAVDNSVAALHEITVPAAPTTTRRRPPVVPAEAPDFVQRVTARMMAGEGDLLPVSAFPIDGTYPLSTTRWERRNIAQEIPVWDASLCIQCNKCALVCPHAAIRTSFYPNTALEGAPATFKSTKFRSNENPDCSFTIQVSPEDCTGCTLCAKVCPAKDKTNLQKKALMMAPQAPLVKQESENWSFFLQLPKPDRTKLKTDLKGSQFMEPLFEFSGACTGCGETPYIKLVTQFFGDRMLVANATGCTSIYGGNLPTTPYCTDGAGRGPAWSNSLFEDNAEYGLGLRLAADQLEAKAHLLLKELAPQLGDGLVEALAKADQSNETGIAEARRVVGAVKAKLAGLGSLQARTLLQIADYLVKKSVWVFGGDGWAYDIGYGGVDHVLSTGRNVNILVLDTEVYSNTGGQKSKSTPIGAVAKFSANGKDTGKKDLALMAVQYGNVYVARIAMGAKDTQTIQAIREAESFDGPSLIIAYAHCIAHGYSLANGFDQQKLAVESGHWPMFRYDPRRIARGEADFVLDSAAPKVALSQYTQNEIRYKFLHKAAPERAKALAEIAQKNVNARWTVYQQMAEASKAAAAAKAAPAAPAAS
ncbi:MAG TPA: pyruvate:ferredoxin (flavodoxin) oxidoreductase [Opitutaceae bacterium]|nr:pyruvate:ferredoxin (flavodoxin) oxidoreductase [Opitutaceae bacterium]